MITLPRKGNFLSFYGPSRRSREGGSVKQPKEWPARRLRRRLVMGCFTVVLLLLSTACSRGTEPPETVGDTPQGQPLSQCQRIADPGRYHLTMGLDGAPIQVSLPPDASDNQGISFDRTCLEIAASDVTLDCRGHALAGSGDPSDAWVGIYLAGSAEAPLSNVRLEGCTVTGYQLGVYAGHVSESAIVDSKATRNLHTGFYLFAASNSSVAGNTAERNGSDGILIARGKNVTVSDNLAFYNRMRGITVDQNSEGCTIQNNESHSHGVLGFAVYDSSNISLEKNNAHDNQYHGFAILHGARSSSFIGNQSHHNDKCGFYLEATDNNTLRDNAAHDNGFDGVVLFEGSHDNLIENNTLRDNGKFGVFSVDTAEGNTLSGNTFSGNVLGDTGTSTGEAIDFCGYTGFGPHGRPCDPVFEGGPNTKDPESKSPRGTEAPETVGDTPQGQPLSQCQRIVDPGRYHLTMGLDGAPIQLSFPPDASDNLGFSFDRVCLEIAASDVTLDCRGHALTGSGDPSDATVGIYLAGSAEAPLSNVRVEGCTVTGYQLGVYAEHVSDSAIVDSKATRNYHTGFCLLAASNTSVAGNTAERNGPDGILIARGKNVTVSDNLAFYNRMRGITVDLKSEGCTIQNNESHSNGVLGFAVYDSSNISLEKNNAHDNRYHGFAILHGARSSSFIGNQSFHNDKCGFYLLATDDNTLRDNAAHDNAFDGVVMFEAHDNLVENNTLRDNGKFGVFSVDSSDTNTVSGNTFSGNGLGDTGSSTGEAIDFCAYTGFGPDGPCDPVFEGGPNTKDPESQSSRPGGSVPAVVGPEPSSRVGVFYYPWYESEPFDGAWGHWEGRHHADGTFQFSPPGDVASDFYPVLGAYSSQDPAVVAEHLAYMRQASIGVVISSWWRPGDYTDQAVPLLLSMAEEYRLKVTFLVEPISMSSPEDMQAAVEYLLDRYVAHPAFYRTTQTSKWLDNPAEKGVIFTWATPPPDDVWNQALDALHAHDDAPLMLANSDDPAAYTEAGHYDGLYNYAYLEIHENSFDWAKQMPDGTLYVPSVMPGFTITRDLGPEEDELNYDRESGATYNYQWQLALGQGVVPWMVTIMSWNEWHEGTQIEPAMSKADLPADTPFRDYGELGPEGYIEITNRWVNTYQEMLSNSP